MFGGLPSTVIKNIEELVLTKFCASIPCIKGHASGFSKLKISVCKIVTAPLGRAEAHRRFATVVPDLMIAARERLHGVSFSCLLDRLRVRPAAANCPSGCQWIAGGRRAVLKLLRGADD